MLYFVSDHAGFALKSALIAQLQAQGTALTDLTPKLIPGDDYSVVAAQLALQLQTEPQALGLAVCGTGQGICMALNRYSWVRAGIGYDVEVVELIRQHNHANVLCLAGRSTTLEFAGSLMATFLSTPESQAERHLRRITAISKTPSEI